MGWLSGIAGQAVMVAKTAVEGRSGPDVLQACPPWRQMALAASVRWLSQPPWLPASLGRLFR